MLRLFNFSIKLVKQTDNGTMSIHVILIRHVHFFYMASVEYDESILKMVRQHNSQVGKNTFIY